MTATFRRIYTINWRSTIHMTLKMTSAQVVETSVVVTNNSSFQNYTNPDDHTQQTTCFIIFSIIFWPLFFWSTDSRCTLSLSGSLFKLFFPSTNKWQWLNHHISLIFQLLVLPSQFVSYNTFNYYFQLDNLLFVLFQKFS